MKSSKIIDYYFIIFRVDLVLLLQTRDSIHCNSMDLGASSSMELDSIFEYCISGSNRGEGMMLISAGAAVVVGTRTAPVRGGAHIIILRYLGS